MKKTSAMSFFLKCGKISCLLPSSVVLFYGGPPTHFTNFVSVSNQYPFKIYLYLVQVLKGQMINC